MLDVAGSLDVAGTLTNQGSIAGANGGTGAPGDTAVELTAGGSLTNDGTITGGTGGAFAQTVIRGFPYISYSVVPPGEGGEGAELGSGSSLKHAGKIVGGHGGAGGVGKAGSGGTLIFAVPVAGGGGGGGAYLDGGTLTNDGTISGGTGGTGNGRVYFGGYIGHGPGGSGGGGVYLDGGTLINAGAIAGGHGGPGSTTGASGDAVQFGTVAATLVVDPGAVFKGLVVANAGAADVFDLAGTSAGTLRGLGTEFANFASLEVAAGSDWRLAGANSLAAGSSIGLGSGGVLEVSGALSALDVAGSLALSGTGTLAVGAASAGMEVGTEGGAAAGRLTVDDGFALSGSGVVRAAFVDNGGISAVGGRLDLVGPATGSGTLAVQAGAVLELAGATALPVDFGTGTATLQLDEPKHFIGTINGLAVGDAIVLPNETVSSAVLSGATLTVTGSAGVTHYTVAGALAGNHVVVEPDDHTVILAAGAALALAPAHFLAPEPAFFAPTQAAPPAGPALSDMAGPAALWADPAHTVGSAGPAPELTAYGGTMAWIGASQTGAHDAWYQPGHGW
jgi:hypothetical protein